MQQKLPNRNYFGQCRKKKKNKLTKPNQTTNHNNNKKKKTKSKDVFEKFNKVKPVSLRQTKFMMQDIFTVKSTLFKASRFSFLNLPGRQEVVFTKLILKPFTFYTTEVHLGVFPTTNFIAM